MSAWLACLVFGVTFLLAMYVGTRTTTAFVRGGIAAFAAHFVGMWLYQPAISAVLAAMARDRAVQATATRGAEEEADE